MRQGAWECGLGGSGSSWTHSRSLSDIDPGAHDIIRRHGLEGHKSDVVNLEGPWSCGLGDQTSF